MFSIDLEDLKQVALAAKAKKEQIFMEPQYLLDLIDQLVDQDDEIRELNFELKTLAQENENLVEALEGIEDANLDP